MGTVIRPETSNRNQYQIRRHRYYELKHFCLQYPDWVKEYRDLEQKWGSSASVIRCQYSEFHDPTPRISMQKASLFLKMKMVDDAAKEASCDLAVYILKGVTENYSYEYLRTVLEIPCDRKTYYRVYRKFFWHLSNLRD